MSFKLTIFTIHKHGERTDSPDSERKELIIHVTEKSSHRMVQESTSQYQREKPRNKCSSEEDLRQPVIMSIARFLFLRHICVENII